MDPDVTDPMSTQTQYPSSNATSAVTVASPALHNYSTVSNHPGIALSTHHHSHLPEPPGYGTSQWYGATNHPPLAPLEMPRMLANPRYLSAPNASGHGRPQGYPTTYGPQYSEPRYLPPAVVPPSYGGLVPYNYHNVPPNWWPQANSFRDMNLWYAQSRATPTPLSNDLHYTTYEYTPPCRPLNALYGNQVHVHLSQFIPRPLQFQGQSSEWPINTSQAPPIQSEVIPPAVAIDTNLACTIPANSIQCSKFSSPQDDLDCQSEKGGICSVLPTAPIASLHNDSSVISSPAAKRLHLTDSLEQSSPFQSLPKISGETESHDNTHLFSQVVLSENNFKSVYEKLYPIRSQWSNFGLALGLPLSTIEQISKDNKLCEDCFCETLNRLFQSRQLTWSKITEALRTRILEYNNLATEIESAVVAMDPPTPALEKLVENISLEELCLLPVDQVWYQLGLWLGVEERRLIQIKKNDEKIKLILKTVLKSFNDSTDYKRLYKGFTDGQTEQAQRLLERKMYDDFIKLFPPEKHIDAKKVVKIWKCVFLQLMTALMPALIKVGKRNVAENICSNKGVSLTDLTDSKPPPECVVMYADYLKSKYREMSILPDPDWPPSIATKEHYTNLALIQKERDYLQTEEDISSISKDYAHGNIDSIIAKKTNIDLEEAFYPIINPKTNESRLTILMDGAPGVGKTTITRKVCIDWAEGDVLPEYQLVILVPLRELKIILLQKFDKQLQLSDILPSDSEELLQNVVKHMMQVSGSETLIIFDGFDELSSQERNFLQRSLVLDIIKGDILHLCSVMITSRPYASQPLRSLSRVNRHIEVLGFTEEQIHDCVCTNIPGKEGEKLIRKLKHRLDIGSLCYIPLNCRIFLFVYEREGFSLPSTITELYEIFLLHTIKRFAQKVTLDEDVSHKIRDAKTPDQIPNIITVQLNTLSKFAFEGIENGKLVFDDSSLNNYVSLGLLNSLHCFITTGEATFFQFLHLTIQEFLAARYVASDAMTDEQRKSFLRSNIENETYRMTLLFLAGLTQFSFFSLGDSLLEPQSTFLSGSSEKERILFLAQIIYESKSSSDYILSHLNGSLDMSGYPLTKFDCFILAHLMSNTPQDFVWEIIDLSNCGITAYTMLLKTKHSKHTMLPGIAISKTLSFFNEFDDKKNSTGSIPITSIVTLLSSFKDSSPIEELALPIMDLRTCKYMVQLSQALVNVKAFRTLKISHYCSPTRQREDRQKYTMISEEDFVLHCNCLSICSNSLMQLLKFASVEIERLEIDGFYNAAFQDCSACGTLGKDAVKSLCEFLRKCKNIERIEFGNYYLNVCAMLSIVSSLSESLTSEIYLEQGSEICDAELVQMLYYLPRKCTIYLKSKRVSIVFKTNQNDLDVSNYEDFKALGYETFLTNIKCVFPRRFTGLSIEVKDTDETLLEYLSQNPNLKMITLTLDRIPQDKVVVRTENSNRMILKLSKSLTSITIKGHAHDYSDILELVAEGVQQSNTLLCMEIIVEHLSHNRTITGLITLLNSLKYTPVQKLCFKNVLFNSVCTEAFIQLLSDNQNITDLAIKGSKYFTDSSCTPSSPTLWSLQMKSLAVLSVSHKLEADGTMALLDFLRLNPQLAVLKASWCHLTDDLFTDTHYWETSSLEELIINGNGNISIEGWTNLFQSLRHNTSLIKLSCYIYADIGEVLNKMIISNKNIQYLETRVPYNRQCNTESLARALIQNLTLKEIRHDDVDDLKREIQTLKRDKNITISPEWNLKIREA